MNKMLFVHDHYFSVGKGHEIYSSAAYPKEFWSRYFEHFDQINVVGRRSDIGSLISGLVRSDDKGVKFFFLNYKHHFINTVDKVTFATLEELVSSVDALVVRLPSNLGIAAFKLAKKLNKPVAVEVVGCAWDAYYNHGSLLGKLYAPISFLRMRSTIAKSNLSLYVTKSFLQSRYHSAKGARTVSASNVQLDYRDIEVNCENLIDRTEVKIGLIGNFKTNYKGIDIALKALKLLERTFPEKRFTFEIVGKGEPKDYDQLCNSLKLTSNVTFKGSMKNGSAIFEWLDTVDIYIQPSRQEGLPRALIEAMSRGLPVIGSRCGGIPELIDNKFIFKKGSHKGLAEKVSLLINHPSLKNVRSFNMSVAKQYDRKKLEKLRRLFYSNLIV